MVEGETFAVEIIGETFTKANITVYDDQGFLVKDILTTCPH
jgi:hypothetical protein